MGRVTRPPLIAAKMTLGVVPLVGVRVSQFPSESDSRRCELDGCARSRNGDRHLRNPLARLSAEHQRRRPDSERAVLGCRGSGEQYNEGNRDQRVATFTGLLKDFSSRNLCSGSTAAPVARSKPCPWDCLTSRCDTDQFRLNACVAQTPCLPRRDSSPALFPAIPR